MVRVYSRFRMERKTTESPAIPDDAGPVIILEPVVAYLRAGAQFLHLLEQLGYDPTRARLFTVLNFRFTPPDWHLHQ